MGRGTYGRLAAAGVASLIAACKEEAPPAPTAKRRPTAAAAERSPRWYRVTLHDPPYMIPFLLELPGSRGGRATIANGVERLPVDARWSGDRVELDFAEFGSSAELVVAGDELRGAWSNELFLKDELPLTGYVIAGPDPALRMAAGDPPSADVSGVWELDIDDYGAGKARLAQRADGVVDGTLIASEVGDVRYLAGRLVGRQLALSTFDGMRSFRFEATLSPDGDELVDGFWHVGGDGHLGVRGRRGRDVPAISLQRARMRAGARRVTEPALADPALAGKPVVLDYFGSWCPACRDSTPVLAALHERYAADGLVVLSIALELADEEDARARVELFRARHAVPYPIVLRIVKDGALSAALPPELEEVSGFPVTLFLDRDHTVRAIHTGFVSPAAGEDYRAVVAHIEDLVAAIVRSPAPAP